MRRGRTNAWMDGGYVELDDSWEGSEGSQGTMVGDVEMREMKEGVGSPKKDNTKEMERQQAGVRKWNSLRDHHHHHHQKDHQRGSRSMAGDLEGIQVRRSVDVTVQVEESIAEHEIGVARGYKRESEYEKGTAL